MVPYCGKIYRKRLKRENRSLSYQKNRQKTIQKKNEKGGRLKEKVSPKKGPFLLTHIITIIMIIIITHLKSYISRGMIGKL